jgi:hypothetical protein
MTHLTSDELIDAMEGILAADRQAHLAACEECRRQLDDLSSVLSDAKQASVPEPSPLFWNHFSTRVNEAIDTEPGGAWPQWLRWQVLLPLGATAMIILALMMAVPKQPAPEFVDDTAAILETPDADNWGVFAELVGDLDLETASAAGVIEPGMAEQAVLQLTAEERQELTRLLQAELTRAKS